MLVKIPFALTGSFKGMLQRGIELTYVRWSSFKKPIYVHNRHHPSHSPHFTKSTTQIPFSTLDASYVSAASWMFLVAFGVKDLQRFFMGEDDGAWSAPC